MTDAAPTKNDRQVVTALVRGLALLRCFNSLKAQLSGAELATLSRLPQPTVWRLCHTLEQLGFLDRVGGDRFRPGLPVRGIGQALLATLPLSERMTTVMRDLGEETGAVIELAVRDGSNMVIVRTLFPEAQLMFRREVGDSARIDNSELGWGYLLGLDDRGRAALLNELSAPKRWSADLANTFERAVREAGSTGALVSIGLFQRDYNCAAVAVGGAMPGYVLSCSGPALNLPPGLLRKTAVPRLIAAARAVGARR